MKRFLLIAFACLLTTACTSVHDSRTTAEPYDESADGETQVKQALTQAKPDNQRVLLVFGANWCVDCRAMDALFKSDKAIAAALKAHYVVAKIDVGRNETPRKNGTLIERFGVAVETGIPVIVVLDNQGKAINDTKNERLADTDHREPAKVLAFLKKWAK